MLSLRATRRASRAWPAAYMTTELARCPDVSEALLTVPLLKPSASTRSPIWAARPGIEVPLRTATVIFAGATAGAVVVVVDALDFFALDDVFDLSPFEPLTSAGTPTAAAAPSTSTPATARTT